MNDIGYFEIFLIILLIAYLYFTNRFRIIITNSSMLTKQQKLINLIMIWVFPFIWFWLIKEIIEPSKTITKKDRDKKTGSFYESGIGVSDM